jgi:hypothetical protein
MPYHPIVSVFSKLRGCSFISVDTTTAVSLSGGKNNPMKDRVTKVVKGQSVIVFENRNTNGFQNMINRRLISENKNPDYKVGGRVWGMKVPNTPVVEHNGQFYLEFVILSSGTVNYYLDGQSILWKDIIGTKPVTTANQNLSSQIELRCVKVENINKIKAFGKTYYNGIDY